MKKIISSLVSGLILAFNTSCGQSDLSSDILLNDVNTVNSLAAKKNSRSTQEVTFATYNVRNLFDGIQNKGKAEETKKPEKELIALAASIKEINADVIAMQEVESKPVLEGFVKKYLPDSNYQVVLIEGNDERGIDVAIITRLPILSVKSNKNAVVNVPGQAPTVLSRDLLQVKLQANENYSFTAFVAHLKSQHGGAEADLIREAEAETIRKIVDNFASQNPNENYIVAGDFNDTYEVKELKPILKSNLNLTDIILKDLGTAQYVYTYHPQKYRSRIDYILVSPSMVKEYVEKSVYIHKTSNTNENKFIFFEASDHLPVTAKFNVAQDL